MDEATTIMGIVEAVGTGGTFLLAVIYLFVRYALPAIRKSPSPAASESAEPSPQKQSDELDRQVLAELAALRDELRGDYREIAEKVDKVAERAERIEQLAVRLDERTKK